MAIDIDASHYNTGSATVAGTAVTGQGTTWLGAVRPGDLFGTHKGSGVRILSVNSNTSLTLAYAVAELEQTAAVYEIQRTPFDVGYYQALENLLLLLGGGNLESFAGLNGLDGKLPMFTGPATLDLISKVDLVSGVKFDVQVADIAARAAYDGQAAGFAVLVANTGDGRSAIYSKVSNASGNWSAPAYLTGPSITLAVTEVDEVPYGTPPEVNMTPRAGGYDLAFDIPRGMIIEPGTTATLAPDQPAAVTFVPVTGGYRLDIAIPAGEGFSSEGDYNAGVAYAKGDVTQRFGSSWIATQATTGNAPPTLPTTSNAFWQLLARQGIDGAGIVSSVVAGAGIEVDSTDPTAPVISTRTVIVAPQGRLSLVSGSPLTTSNVLGATTIFYVPCAGNVVPIFDGTSFVPLKLSAQLTFPLDADTGHAGYHADFENYDLFVFMDGATARLASGPRWQEGTVGGSDTLRGTGAGSTELEIVDGLLVNKNSIALRYGALTGERVTVAARRATYVGSFTAEGNGLASDSERMRLLFNAYNRLPRKIYCTDTTATWPYSTDAWRYANGNGNNRIMFLVGTAGASMHATAQSFVSSSTSTPRRVQTAIGLDDLIAADGCLGGRHWAESGKSTTFTASFADAVGIGRHALTWLERGGGADTQTWFGSAAGEYGVGIVGEMVN